MEFCSRPKLTYVQLIQEAIRESAEGKLKLNDIYQAIQAKHPFYR